MVGDITAIAKDGGLQTIETRDVRVNNTVFPSRVLGMRPESDVIFYTLLDATERQEMQLCLGCGQPKLNTPPTCSKCVDPTINKPHDRDYTCFYGSCRCKHSRTNNKSFWFLYPEESEEELFGTDKYDDGAAETVGTVVDVQQLMRNDADSFDDVENNPLVQFQRLSSPTVLSPSAFGTQHEYSFGAQETPILTFNNLNSVPEAETSTQASSVSGQREESIMETDNTHISPLYLTKAIPVSEAAGVAEGAAAIKKEVETMKRYCVWDDNEVMEKEAAVAQYPNAQFVKVKLITAIKNAESEASSQKYKARLVAQGCAMRDIHGYITNDFEYPFEAPSNLSSLRLALWYASRNNNSLAIADVEGAYLHAVLGGPPTFLTLPAEARPRGWETMENPVVRAKKAIYGLSRSGSDFAIHAKSILGKYGWTNTSSDMSLYSKNHMLLLIYVDDIMIVGPQDRLPRELENLKAGFGINSFQTLDDSTVSSCIKYLGITITSTPTHIELSMERYTRSILEEYCLAIGQPVLRKAKSPGWTDISSVEEATAPGSLAPRAAEFVGKLLWMSRTTRPDITFAVHYLSGLVSKWSVHADKALGRIMQYLFHYPSLGIAYERKTGKPIEQVKIITFVDADHAGQALSTRSTNGYAIYLEDGNIRDLVDWSSKRQSTTALSTAEAELMAMSHGLKMTLAHESFFEEAFGATDQIESIIFCDNQTAIQAVENGYSIRMRHLTKAHRVNLGFIHDVFNCKRRKLLHVPTAENIADIFTKSLSPEPYRNLKSQIVVKLEAQEIE